MFKKIVLILCLVASFNLIANEQKVDDSKKKSLEQKNTQKKDENILEIENMVEANILIDKINKIEASFKDNILLKRYSNYLSYSKISNELETLKESLKRKIN